MCAAISIGEKMASARNDHLMKQCSVIEFLTAEGCSAVVIHKRMKAVYGDACLTEVHLGYRKVSARWVPRQLTVEMKAQRKTICTQLLERFTHDGERFLRSIITGDESWVHHYDPESKMQSMQYRHKNSPALKKFKVIATARKVLLTIFWDMEGIVHIEFLEQGTTINSERSVSTLRALKGRLRRVRQDKVKDVVIQHDNARPHTSR
ncbi:histone-lysine N-methyltransferase SETMAR [Elysia marginata]|uniref:Histone-lysine N-methyltransferase SETMAR n=1 Tax=Elysia marginata TaxID=1093978 RepID=A0AAV4G2S0_9GAST|nr:histone-lysine N-methyltransferase SETMAR [Elysia marginata]